MKLVYDANGKAVSMGLVLTDELPPGLTAVELSQTDEDRLKAGSTHWDPATLSVVPLPGFIDPLVIQRNRGSIETRLTLAMAAMQAIIDAEPPVVTSFAQAQAVAREQARNIKDQARILRALIRHALAKFDAAD